jgi:CRISPR-associated endonuclease Csy4
MKVYIDITLLPSDDIGHHFLWEKVYQQLHIALVDFQKTNANSEIGIGFPEFNAKNHRLGRKARVFASTLSALEQFNVHRWLERLLDYVHLTSVREVPGTVEGYERFSRLQVKGGNPERYARRAAKRQGISYEQALEERKSIASLKAKNPFIWMKSLSTDSRFRLLIEQERLDESGLEVDKQSFDGYGLVKKGALPYF